MGRENWNDCFQTEEEIFEDSSNSKVWDRVKNEMECTTHNEIEEKRKEANQSSSLQTSPINKSKKKRDGSLRMILN
jgi:hypothetical protein